MTNPFRIKTILPGSPFCDRQEELRTLLSRARDRANVVLYSPRRFGKTSLVLRVQRALAEEGAVTAYVDFFGVDSVRDAAERVARGVLLAIHRQASLLDKGRRFLRHFTVFRPVFRPDPEGGAALSLEAAPKAPMDLLEGAFAELGAFAETSGLAVHVALDEFQELCRLKESGQVEGIMRAHIQRQRASYVFLGSRRGMLLAMFNERKRPFFQSAFALALPPLPLEELTDFLALQFREAGKACAPGLAGEIARAVSGHPYYSQRLANEVFGLAPEEVRPEHIRQALVQVAEAERFGFEALLGQFTGSQARVLKALAREPGAVLSQDFLARCGLAAGTAQAARNRLRDEDVIEEAAKGRWQVVDPVFARWLAGM